MNKLKFLCSWWCCVVLSPSAGASCPLHSSLLMLIPPLLILVPQTHYFWENRSYLLANILMYEFFTPTYYSNQGLNFAIGLYVSMCMCVWGVYLVKRRWKIFNLLESWVKRCRSESSCSYYDNNEQNPRHCDRLQLKYLWNHAET